MAKPSSFNIDLNSVFERAGSQFRGLNMNEPGQWPTLPKLAAWAGMTILAVFLGWTFFVKDASTALEEERNREPALKQDYRAKLAQAVNLNELRKQKLQVEEYVMQLEKQLPGKAEMDALLSDINQAGLGRGLLFELFRPGTVDVKDYYAELPISIRVTGRYHDLGAFAADVSNLSRIVTLHNLNITQATSRDQPAGATLAMDATARTYRYLDSEEVAEQQRAKAARAQQQGARR